MKYSKVREVKDPFRGTQQSAGIDFFVPKFTNQFKKDLRGKNEKVFIRLFPNEGEYLELGSGDDILLPTGIKVNLEEEQQKIPFLSENGQSLCLQVKNKSGVSTKKKLIKGAELIDEDYQGELHVHLFNMNSDSVFIKEDEKVVQMVLTPIFYPSLEHVEEQDLFNKKSQRGESGFGHTG